MGGVPEQDPAPVFGGVTIPGLGQSRIRLRGCAPAEAGGPQDGRLGIREEGRPGGG